MRTRIEPMKKFAQTLRNHKEWILNWFDAKAGSENSVFAEVQHAGWLIRSVVPGIIQDSRSYA